MILGNREENKIRLGVRMVQEGKTKRIKEPKSTINIPQKLLFQKEIFLYYKFFMSSSCEISQES